MMIESGEGDFAAPAESINIVQNQTHYNLANLLSFNPAKIRIVERFFNNYYVTLKKWEKNDGVIYAPGIGESDFTPTYRFVGTNLVFNLIPGFSSVNGIRIEASKLPDEMVLDGESPNANFHPIYHNLLVLWATVGCIESKEFTGMEGDASMFRVRPEKLEAQFISIMSNRTECPEYVTPFGLTGDY